MIYRKRKGGGVELPQLGGVWGGSPMYFALQIGLRSNCRQWVVLIVVLHLIITGGQHTMPPARQDSRLDA
jgi:hypothetical protein